MKKCQIFCLTIKIVRHFFFYERFGNCSYRISSAPVIITQYSTQHSPSSYKLSIHANPTNALLITNKAFAYTYYTLQLAQHVFFQNIIQYAHFSTTHSLLSTVLVYWPEKYTTINLFIYMHNCTASFKADHHSPYM